MEIIDHIGWYLTKALVLLFAGWLFFKIRYRKSENQKAILEEKFEGDYSNVSLLFLIKLTKYFFGSLLIVSLLLLIISIIWAGIKDNF